MKQDLSKRMTVLTVIVILFGVLSIVATLIATGNTVGLFSIGCGTVPTIDWDGEFLVWKILMLLGLVVSGLTTNILLIAFMWNTVKLIKSGEFFSHLNTKILWWLVPFSFLNDFLGNNADMLFKDTSLTISHGSIFIPLLIAVVALIYSTGVLLTEENRLTV
ncbi:MAG: hypothetical protein IIU69_04000 [Bacteroidaceae bacterium]|nr:hypothetical protein [Bacteroidaceae bacterium]